MGRLAPDRPWRTAEVHLPSGGRLRGVRHLEPIISTDSLDVVGYTETAESQWWLDGEQIPRWAARELLAIALYTDRLER